MRVCREAPRGFVSELGGYNETLGEAGQQGGLSRGRQMVEARRMNGIFVYELSKA